MHLQTLIRFGAYPVVFGGVASFVFTWSTLGHSPWPAFAIVAVLGIFAVAVLERVQPFEPDWNRDHDDSITDALHVLVNLALLAGTAHALHALAGMLPTSARWPDGWPVVLQILLAGAILDLGLYGMHRLSHRVPWLWRLHAVHHSAERLYWMNGERRHPLSAVLLAGPGLIVTVALGAPPSVITAWLTMLSVHLGFQHANLDYSLGPLRRWIGGAELHRWHHRRDYAEAQVNFGEFWLVWDALFGTRHDSPSAVRADDVGLDGRPVPTTYLGQLVWPLQSGTVEPTARAE
jgi:sterol desaturase/sphingolipid hydroxylase (fatty acid hydroxylase superfamily)